MVRNASLFRQVTAHSIRHSFAPHLRKAISTSIIKERFGGRGRPYQASSGQFRDIFLDLFGRLH